MLKKILSMSGKPGLYRLISYGKGIIIVENVTDNKRMPAYTRDKIIALGDIAIYTDDTEVPLADVLTTIAEKYNSQVLDTKLYKSAAQLQQFFEEVLPNYDHDRVYNTDIKKIISWYNTLISAGITDFSIKSEEESAKQENE